MDLTDFLVDLGSLDVSEHWLSIISTGRQTFIIGIILKGIRRWGIVLIFDFALKLGGINTMAYTSVGNLLSGQY